MKLALLQMEVLEKNKAGNVEKACNLLKQAAPQADIAVLPEIWTTGYSLGHLSKEAEYLNGPVIEEIRSMLPQTAAPLWQVQFLCARATAMFITLPLL